ncbi:MAG: hypothetical protein HW404_2262 [Anaerolineales bacterium]|nr:hypothetical protein [Anaerolineales bacterium]
MLYCAFMPTTMAKLLVLLLTPLAPSRSSPVGLSAVKPDAQQCGQVRRGGWMFLKEGAAEPPPSFRKFSPPPAPIPLASVRSGPGEGKGWG